MIMINLSIDQSSYQSIAVDWRRGVVRSEILPKAAYLEGRCRGVVRLEISPKAAYREERCRGVFPFRVPTKEDCLQRFARLGFRLAMFPRGAVFTFRFLA